MQTIKLNLIPGSVLPVVNVSQYDAHRQFALQVYEGAASYSLTGKTVEIRGTKPDGNGFAYDAQDGVVSVSGNTVTISTTQQMTVVGGHVMTELRITSGQTILGTLNFIIDVEPSALSDDTPISDTDIPAIERDFEAALAEAEADALKAEGQAQGTQDGTPVGSGSPYYQNNAKYYKEQADTDATNAGNSATSAEADALKSEGYAIGKQNGTAVTSGSPYYQNNAQYFDTHASEQAYNASQSANSASGSATAASTDALKSEGWAVGEQNGTPVTSGSPYYHNNAEYYKDQAAQYAAGGLTFQGSVVFASIPTTGMANGDMYNITDDFTTDARFIEGAGVPVKAGADIAWVAGSVNKWDILALGGGSDDYSQLINKPQINSVELNGNKTPAELGLATDAAMTGASAGSAGAKGLVPAPAAGDQDKVLCGDGTWKTPSGGSDMTGATASTPGTHGLVPAPAAGDNTKFLRGDGTWAEAGGGGGGGFSLSFWLSAGGLNPAAYADLAAVLADEEAVRRLMTIHLAVDYLASMTTADADVTTILTSDICAKWINLRDYALDTLYANATLAAVMDTADKYFLGEWALLSTSPDTWGPKGNVPIMTSNTAPYGTASAYQVFDGNSATTASGTDFSYKFVNPVCVKDFVVKDGSGNAITGGTLQASNDGSTWVTPVADTFYMAWNVHFGSSTTVGTVQFYGRTLKVSVPTMTSNTAPYGEVIYHSTVSGYPAWKAFDGDVSTPGTGANSDMSSGAYIGYKFPSSVKIGMFAMKGSNSTKTNTVKLQASDDGLTWDDTSQNTAATYNTVVTGYADTDVDGRYCRIYQVSATGGNSFGFYYIQFWGFDYSEYDWDADNPRHYLYDHGVELETLTYTKNNDACTATSVNGELVLSVPATARRLGAVSKQIDFTSYNLMRMVAGDTFAGSTNMSVSSAINNSSSSPDVTDVATMNPNPASAGQYNISLDISSVNTTYYAVLYALNGSGALVRTQSAAEWWLE